MSESALLGQPRPFSFRGKHYFVAVRDLFIELAFADWVMAEAGLAIARMRQHWPAEFRVEQEKNLTRDIAAKKLRWGGEVVHDASWAEEGRRQLLFLKMKRGEEHGGHPVERELVDEIAKDEEAYDRLYRIMVEQDYPFLLPPKRAASTTESQLPPSDSASTPKA